VLAPSGAGCAGTGASVVEPKQPTGFGFEEAAVAAAYELAFAPAEIEGKPVAVQILYTFKFVPPKPEAPATPSPAVAPVQPQTLPAPSVKNFAGILRERGTRLPLGGTLVTVYRDDGPKPVGFECTSDQGGHFAFFDLAPGPWQVQIELPGYYPFHTTEEMRAGELVQVGYFIERRSYNPFDVLVESPRPRKEVTRVVIESEVIEKVPGAMGDALSALQNYAGVGRVMPGEGMIIVRGAAPNDSKVFVDGIEIPIAYHFGGMRSVLPTAMLDSLDFYPGNFSSYYSRATGGVIDVNLKKPRARRWTGYVDVSLLDSSLFLEAPVTAKLTLMGGFRRSYIDAYIGKVIPDSVPIRMTQLPVYYGKPLTPVTGAVLDMDAGSYQPIYGAKYSDRNPMFAQWDLRIDKKWVFDRFMLDLYLDVWNVTNRANVEAPDYNFDYSKRKTENGLSTLPILGLRAEL
jgi:hypothetical protein